MGSYRQVVLLLDFVVLIDDEHARVLGLVTTLDDDLVTVERILVGSLLTEVLAFDHSVETDGTVGLDDGDCVICVPLTDEVSLLNRVAFLLVEY